MPENNDWNFLEWLRGVIARDNEVEALEAIWNMDAQEEKNTG